LGRYYIAAPEKPWDRENREDENWNYGWLSDTRYLKPAAIVSLQRRIEDVKRHCREVWETWAKILGGVIPGLAALVTAFVPLILAWGQ
jgi:hypothetical protein